jgi:hypothetical protein
LQRCLSRARRFAESLLDLARCRAQNRAKARSSDGACDELAGTLGAFARSLTVGVGFNPLTLGPP